MSNSYLFPVDAPATADSGDELGIQIRLRSRLRMIAPTLRVVAVPNAGKRTAWAAMKAKSEGLAAGFPDLIILWSGGAAFLEIKNRIGSLTVEQVAWLNFLHQAGHPCGVFRGVDSAIDFLRQCDAPFMSAAA